MAFECDCVKYEYKYNILNPLSSSFSELVYAVQSYQYKYMKTVHEA